MMGCMDGNEDNKVASSFKDLNLRPHHVITSTFSAKDTNSVISSPITPPNSNHSDSTATATANRPSLFNHHTGNIIPICTPYYFL